MEKVIKITGKGKISVKPDTIKLSINASDVYKDYSECLSSSSRQTRVIRQAVEEAGLDSEQLKTVNFSVNTEYERIQDENNKWRSALAGYRYNHSLYIQFANDNEILGKVLYQLAKCDTNASFSIEHTVKDQEAVKKQLLEMAVEDCKEKAGLLTNSAGVTLGDIISIDYSFADTQMAARVINDLPKAKVMALDEAALQMDIEADDIVVEDQVTICWQII